MLVVILSMDGMLKCQPVLLPNYYFPVPVYFHEFILIFQPSSLNYRKAKGQGRVDGKPPEKKSGFTGGRRSRREPVSTTVVHSFGSSSRLKQQQQQEKNSGDDKPSTQPGDGKPPTDSRYVNFEWCK